VCGIGKSFVVLCDDGTGLAQIFKRIHGTDKARPQDLVLRGILFSDSI
jgi:hypothetical protein